MCVLLITQILRFVGRLRSCKPGYHTRLITEVTITDRPALVRNRCVFEGFGGVFVSSVCFLGFSVGIWIYVKGLVQISYFSL